MLDARSGEHVMAFPGHRDAVTGLAFREGGLGFQGFMVLGFKVLFRVKNLRGLAFGEGEGLAEGL